MKASNDAGQQLITSCIKNMQSADFAKRKSTFETAYFIAKEEMRLIKYPQIPKLERKHGADIGTAFLNKQCGTNFINYIREELGSVWMNYLFFDIIKGEATQKLHIQYRGNNHTECQTTKLHFLLE